MEKEKMKSENEVQGAVADAAQTVKSCSCFILLFPIVAASIAFVWHVVIKPIIDKIDG